MAHHGRVLSSGRIFLGALNVFSAWLFIQKKAPPPQIQPPPAKWRTGSGLFCAPAEVIKE